MFCPNCGTKIEEGIFCPACGTKVVLDAEPVQVHASQAPVYSAPVSQPASAPAPVKKPIKKIGLESVSYRVLSHYVPLLRHPLCGFHPASRDFTHIVNFTRPKAGFHFLRKFYHTCADFGICKRLFNTCNPIFIYAFSHFQFLHSTIDIGLS